MTKRKPSMEPIPGAQTEEKGDGKREREKKIEWGVVERERWILRTWAQTTHEAASAPAHSVA